jgi:hypothetical protein
MTRTSKALKRLGTAGLVVVTLGAGIPALAAIGAQAAANDPSVIYIRPSQQAGTPGTCLNYVVNAYDVTGAASNNATITVTLSPDTTPATPVQDVDFCQSGTTPEPHGSTNLGADNGSAGAAPSTPSNVSNGGVGVADTGTFKTDAAGQFTFGVFSNQSGNVAIRAFFDLNSNGTFNAGEPQTQAGGTFGPGGASGTNAQSDVVRCVDATPESATNPIGQAHTFKAQLTNNSANPTTTAAPGPTVKDSGVAACTGNPVPGVAPVFTVTDTDGTPDATLSATCGASNNDGIATCSYTRSTATTDTIQVYVNQSNGATGAQEGLPGCTTQAPAGVVCEPGDTINKTYIAAQTLRNVAITCNAQNAPAVPPTNYPTQTSAKNCLNQTNDTDRTFTATVSNTTTTSTVDTNGTLIQFTVTGGSGDETLTQPQCPTAGGPGAVAGNTSSCSTDVVDPTPVSGEVLTVVATIRGTSATDSGTLTYFSAPADARNISLAPKTATTTPGGVRSFTATVVDSQGKPVPGVTVRFTESGPGAFRDGSSQVDRVTDNAGQAVVEASSLSTESGAQTITATIQTAGTECTRAAGVGTVWQPVGGNRTGTNAVPASQTAGNCSDTATNTFGSPSPSPTSSGGRAALTLVVNTPSIAAGSTARLTATGAKSEAYQLQCYTRPSTTYFTARSGSFDAAGSPVTFTLSLGRNTRCFIQYATTSTQGASPSVVINVHTVLSLSTVRTGVRTYIFQGRNLPRVAGQLITLYRVTSSGTEIRTSNLTTDSTGIYRVTRTFTGTGTFQFKVRTSQTLNNAAGVSNTITVAVH